MLTAVSNFMEKLSEIQDKKTDVEFVKNDLHGIVTRQTYAAYKSGSREVQSDFIDAVTVIFPEMHLLASIAKDEIGKNIIQHASLKK
jgi:hypothetical protein